RPAPDRAGDDRRGSAPRARALHHGRQPHQALGFTDQHLERSAPRTAPPGDLARAWLQRLRHFQARFRRSYLISRRRGRRAGGGRVWQGSRRPRGARALLLCGWAPSRRSSSVAALGNRSLRPLPHPAATRPSPLLSKSRRRRIVAARRSCIRQNLRMGIRVGERVRPTVARVDLGAVRGNFQAIVEHLKRGRPVGTPGVIAVVKANAYGHGAAQVARALEDAGAALLACADIEEGAALRAAGVRAEILVFGALSVSDLDGVFDCRLTPTISSPGAPAAPAARHRQRLRYHLKIDTGMNRLGFRFDNLRRTLPEVLASEHLELDRSEERR